MPAWSAAIVQLPEPTKLTVLPDTVQTLVVKELNVTAFPDAPPVADTVYVPPYVGLVGVDVNTMVCVPVETRKLCVACDAAA